MAVGACDAYDPAYDDLKRMAVQFKEWIAAEKKRKPLRMGRLITLHDRLARILEKTCQYEKPKLQAITLAGDHNNPVQVGNQTTPGKPYPNTTEAGFMKVNDNAGSQRVAE